MKLGALSAPALALSLVACGTSSPVGGGSGLDSRSEAAHFLTQATFGPTLEDIEALAANRDYRAWLEQQRAAPISLELPYLQQQDKALTQGDRLEAWWRFAVTGEDQLRQRMAFALSEILVVSDQSILFGSPEGVAYYYDLLAKGALGNYRDLMTDATLSPAMGHFLNMFRNQKPDPGSGRRSDENYAREVMQLFSIGLAELNLDGTPKRDGDGREIPTFTQSDVANLARVFTGWSSSGGSTDMDFFTAPENWTAPMQPYENFHDTTSKRIVGNTAIPAGMQARPELDLALDVLFNHPNVGPFIGKQLIKRLVTSNPSPAYVGRIAQVFNDNGQGVRGDLFALARAILLDPEARTSTGPATGKLREPLLRVTHLWRAFKARADNNRYDYNQAGVLLAEAPLSAPTVFNFFRPEFRAVGVLSQAGLVGPEFGITDETTIVNVSNEVHRMTRLYRGAQGPSSATPGDVLLDFVPWQALAGDPEHLVDDLNLLLMSGRMPAAMRKTLVDFAGTIPADQPDTRIAETLHLVVTSPQYAAEH